MTGSFVTGLLVIILGLVIAVHGVRKRPKDKREAWVGLLIASLASLHWYLTSKETARMEEQLEEAKQKVEALEAAQQPRGFSPSARYYIVETLTEYAGQTITISPVGSGAEVNKFAREIEAILTDAGWNVTFSGSLVMKRPMIGLEVSVSIPREPPAVVALIQAFHKGGIVIKRRSPSGAVFLVTGPQAPISLMVGEKPR